MILATTPRWLEAQKSHIKECMEKNIAVHVIVVSHVCPTVISLENFLKSTSPPRRCVIIEENMRQEVLKMNISLNEKMDGKVMSSWCPNCCQTTFKQKPRKCLKTRTDNV